MPGSRGTIRERFDRRVVKTPSCWIWAGGLRDRHYGSVSLGAKSAGTDYAHRVSWKLHYGEIPTGMSVCHHCDNPRCVRPDHLFLATHTHNMRDKTRKCRGANHTTSGKARRFLGPAERGLIFRELAAGQTMRAIAEQLGVTRNCVSMIANGHRGRLSDLRQATRTP